MIRRLLVSFVAIVMALAAGIALGGGPLSDIGRTPSQAAVAPQPVTDPQADARAAYADAFATGIAEHPADWHMLQRLWLDDLAADDPRRARLA